MSDRLRLSAWYLLIAALAWWGLIDAVDRVPDDFVYFSNINMLADALVFTATGIAQLHGRPGRVSVIARGACATYGLVVVIIFNTLLGADLSRISSLLEHAVVPALVMIDWLFVRRQRVRLRASVVSLWMLVPLLYIPVYTLNRKPNGSGEPIYDFLDPDASSYWPMVAGFALFFVVIGLLMWGLRMTVPRRSNGPEDAA